MFEYFKSLIPATKLCLCRNAKMGANGKLSDVINVDNSTGPLSPKTYSDLPLLVYWNHDQVRRLSNDHLSLNECISANSYPTMQSITTIDFSKEFGVRLTTVGIPPNRGLSSKVVGLASSCPVVK